MNPTPLSHPTTGGTLFLLYSVHHNLWVKSYFHTHFKPKQKQKWLIDMAFVNKLWFQTEAKEYVNLRGAALISNPLIWSCKTITPFREKMTPGVSEDSPVSATQPHPNTGRRSFISFKFLSPSFQIHLRAHLSLPMLSGPDSAPFSLFSPCYRTQKEVCVLRFHTKEHWITKDLHHNCTISVHKHVEQ